MEVEVVRSRRRRKTVQARRTNGVVRVSIPATMSKADEKRWVQEMVSRLERAEHRRTNGTHPDPARRAARLAHQYGLPRPKTVRWVDNQHGRWASCTPDDGAIRVSSRLAEYPAWVIDYVLVHELAHLAEPGHGRAFWDLVSRYPKAERARGFLIAKGLEAEE
jgi:predicted metal-dependent hydrolase